MRRGAGSDALLLELRRNKKGQTQDMSGAVIKVVSKQEKVKSKARQYRHCEAR